MTGLALCPTPAREPDAAADQRFAESLARSAAMDVGGLSQQPHRSPEVSRAKAFQRPPRGVVVISGGVHQSRSRTEVVVSLRRPVSPLRHHGRPSVGAT